jgi:tetratricopeptide (TPR) repeat protein
MIDSRKAGSTEGVSKARCSWVQRGILAAVCALVIGVYAYTARSGYITSPSLNAADNCYNLLVQGFQVGQLSLKREVPLGLAQSADPCDPAVHSQYGVLDMSYYRGKLYLYFGVIPAVALFWPYVALTGRYLLQRDAVVIFCLVGFLASVGLLCALWRRYFTEVSVWVVAAGALALGLVTCMPFLLAQCDVYEVSVSCGYALTMLVLAAIWKALHESRTRLGWLAAASLAYGLAVGARPSLLFGAVVLLVPVGLAWRKRQQVWTPLIAAIGPMAVIGCGLMVYNAWRFDSPFEFGGHYQLGEGRRLTQHFWSVRYLWFNFRVYFLEPARWRCRFPFVHDIRIPTVPAGHGRIEKPFGVLANIPLAWLAVAVPLAWRKRSAEARANLCRFLGVVVALFGICALTLCVFFATCTRYEVEFLCALVLLAVVGILSVERALAPTSESGQAGRPVWRRAVRWGLSLLLVFSVAFNLLASVERCAEAHNNLGDALQEAGEEREALKQYRQALRLDPDYAEAHNGLGTVLTRQGRLPDAIGQYEQALHVRPDSADAHYNLGVALERAGLMQEAIEHWEQTLRLDPDDAEAHNNLGAALTVQGKIQEAIGQYQQALRVKPDYAEAHNNLGATLRELGRLQEAIGHYEQALRLNPDYAEAHNNLGSALLDQGRLQEAISHWEQALHLAPDSAITHLNLGLALERLGHRQEAIQHYEQALRIKPDFVQAQSALVRVRAAP